MKMSEQTSERTATFRFYGELADFLPTDARGLEREYRFRGNPSIKDAIEAQGVPHTEVDLILACGESVGFDFLLPDNTRVAVYPPFTSLDATVSSRLRDPVPNPARFAVDVNLGKLARWIRMLGFDATYRNDIQDRELVALTVNDKRILLTRDRRLLRHKELSHAYWVRSNRPERQVVEVLRRYRLEGQTRPFRHCTVCNGKLHTVSKAAILHRLEPLTREHYDEFFQCDQCSRLYWQGSHHQRLREKITQALAAAKRGQP